MYDYLRKVLLPSIISLHFIIYALLGGLGFFLEPFELGYLLKSLILACLTLAYFSFFLFKNGFQAYGRLVKIVDKLAVSEVPVKKLINDHGFGELAILLLEKPRFQVGQLLTLNYISQEMNFNLGIVEVVGHNTENLPQCEVKYIRSNPKVKQVLSDPLSVGFMHANPIIKIQDLEASND